MANNPAVTVVVTPKSLVWTEAGPGRPRHRSRRMASVGVLKRSGLLIPPFMAAESTNGHPRTIVVWAGSAYLQ